MPTRKPGRVTRSSMVLGSWQSTQLTGWFTSWSPLSFTRARASWYFMAHTSSKPFMTSPFPTYR